jgi:hypothetical protein
MNSGESKPARGEIEKQLNRIIGSKAFESHLTLCQLLKRLVNDSFNGEPIRNYEYKLGREIFGKRKGWIPDNESVVRQGMTNLRRALDKYYKGEGSEDRVVIDVPGRQGHQPKYSYNTRSAAAQRYRSSLELFDRTFLEMVPDTAFIVVQDFETGIRRETKSYAPAYSSLAEIILIYTLWEVPGFRPRERLLEIERLVGECLVLNDHDWLAHIVSGVLHSCRFDWEKATRAFDVALSISADETRFNFWYQAFLCAVGKTDVVLEWAQQCFRAVPRSDSALTRLALFVYAGRNFPIALAVLGQAPPNPLGKNNWPVELLTACIFAGQGRGEGIRSHASNAHKSSTLSAGLKIMGEAKIARDDGLPAYLDSALETAKLLERNPSQFGPICLALAYIGLGLAEDAIRMLKHACEAGSPLMVWLHLWPIFDPLREHESFRPLIDRMNLPMAGAPTKQNPRNVMVIPDGT